MPSPSSATGSINLAAYPLAPRNWALAEGQIMPIRQNAALYSLLGTFYGGNGATTFALPDLRGRGPVGQGRGPLTDRDLGESFGQDATSLRQDEMPPHRHVVALGDETPGGGAALASGPAGASVPAITELSGGGGEPFETRSPATVLTYLVCLSGIYPVRQQ